jgi:hypothetical protein
MYRGAEPADSPNPIKVFQTPRGRGSASSSSVFVASPRRARKCHNGRQRQNNVVIVRDINLTTFAARRHYFMEMTWR